MPLAIKRKLKKGIDKLNIHKTAIVDPKAELAEDVTIGAYAVINGDVKIGAGTKIGEHCVVARYTSIGEACQIFSGAVIGSVSQDKKFKGTRSCVVVGNNNIIREYVTINRGTLENSRTIVGDNNIFMAYSHIAHNCQVGDNVILANCVALAGDVMVEDGVVIGGLSGVHQFVRIGKLSIVGGCSKVVQDIVPYSMADGHRAKIYGVNSVGLERAGIPDEIRDNLKKAFKILFSMKLNIKNALDRIKKEVPSSKEIGYLVHFIESSQRGISK